ncbi:metalloregulator ArsR/SmtB family transcription factor [Parvularcula sp. LCG005]|uniref:ArsR/SmtB family transcription factor n=1 Tax=Parvularcula sp. LCG005 TaxID=3078805 RepID=UPI0029420B07|nr:metalloregulator ArsR/SmtB family transcription factor [Parvularcula sp. LCG005]WOI53205.1 metalloregulator ArsR/SmtB family transcription factor [Parvularcula sp. LCG005]
MDAHLVANRFGALAQTTRLNILRQLAAAGPDGLPAGELANLTKVPASTLSFHLKELTRNGLITSERQGRLIVYRADIPSLRGLARMLEDDFSEVNVDLTQTSGRPSPR